MVLTTQEGVQPEGLTFPTVPGTYKMSFTADADSNINYNIHNQLYIEVYGTPFTTLSIYSMVTIPSQRNLLWIKLTPTTTIETTEQLTFEFPTKSTAGLLLFDDDLGTGLADGAFINADVIGGDFSNSFMKCKIFHGDQTFAKSAKIVCGEFSESIESNELLFFAIKIINPALSGGRVLVSIPLFVHSMEQGKTYKKNFNVY
jgi:hypothetical protein